MEVQVSQSFDRKYAKCNLHFLFDNRGLLDTPIFLHVWQQKSYHRAAQNKTKFGDNSANLLKVVCHKKRHNWAPKVTN